MLNSLSVSDPGSSSLKKRTFLHCGACFSTCHTTAPSARAACGCCCLLFPPMSHFGISGNQTKFPVRKRQKEVTHPAGPFTDKDFRQQVLHNQVTHPHFLHAPSFQIFGVLTLKNPPFKKQNTDVTLGLYSENQKVKSSKS